MLFCPCCLNFFWGHVSSRNHHLPWNNILVVLAFFDDKHSCVFAQNTPTFKICLLRKLYTLDKLAVRSHSSNPSPETNVSKGKHRHHLDWPLTFEGSLTLMLWRYLIYLPDETNQLWHSEMIWFHPLWRHAFVQPSRCWNQSSIQRVVSWFAVQIHIWIWKRVHNYLHKLVDKALPWTMDVSENRRCRPLVDLWPRKVQSKWSTVNYTKWNKTQKKQKLHSSQIRNCTFSYFSVCCPKVFWSVNVAKVVRDMQLLWLWDCSLEASQVSISRIDKQFMRLKSSGIWWRARPLLPKDEKYVPSEHVRASTSWFGPHVYTA